MGLAPAPPHAGLRTRVPFLRTPVLPLSERRPHQSGPVPTDARQPTRWCPTTSGRSLPAKNGRERDGEEDCLRARPDPGGGRIGRGGFRDPGDARASSPDAGERPGPRAVVGRPAVRSRRDPPDWRPAPPPVVVRPDPPRMPPRAPVPLPSRGRTPASVPRAFPRPRGDRVDSGRADVREPAP